LWRYAAAICLLAAVISFGLSIYGVAYAPMATFYLLPTRAWELMVGSLLAFGLFPALNRKLAGWEALAGLALILVPVFLYSAAPPLPRLAPGPRVVGPVLPIPPGLGALPAGRAAFTTRLVSSPPLRFIGLISYSLYLIHWPIVVFM